MMEPDGQEEALFCLRYQLTEEEIRLCLKWDGGRKAGRARLAVETAALGLMAVYSLAAFFIDGMRNMPSLLIGAACIVLTAVLWLLPVWWNRADARREAAQGKWVTLRLFADGLGFGDGEAYRRLPLEAVDARFHEDLAVLRVEGSLLAVPRRAMEGEQWAQLRQTLDLNGNPAPAADH